MGFFDKSGDISVRLTITAGKKNLNMGMLSSTIVMRQNGDGQVYFDTLPGDFFILDDYSWEGPCYKTVTTTNEKGKNKGKEVQKRKGGLGGAAIGTLLMPGVGTAIGYAMTSKKVKKGKGKTNTKVVVDESQVEVPGTASIRLKNVATGGTFSFGFECDSKVNVELDAFDWSHVSEEEEDEAAAVQSQTDKIKLLKEYKELLDQGIITQEEFDQKKAELI